LSSQALLQRVARTVSLKTAHTLTA